MSIRVLVADDQEIVRTGLRMILDAQPGIEVVGEAGDGRTAVALARELRPDVCLLDIRMPEMNGIEATTLLAGPDVADPLAVVVITTFDLDEYVHGALRAGARGFLLKDAGPELLVQAVHAAAHGRRADRAERHGPAARGVRRRRDAGAAAQPIEPLTAPRGGGAGRRRSRPDQRRDLRRAAHQPEHREDPHRQPDGEARGAGTGSRSRCGPTRPTGSASAVDGEASSTFFSPGRSRADSLRAPIQHRRVGGASIPRREDSRTAARNTDRRFTNRVLIVPGASAARVSASRMSLGVVGER